MDIKLTSEQLEIIHCLDSISVNGVAGCGKTSTICEKTRFLINRNYGNTLILTMVGSVTEELTHRLNATYNLTKQGGSNHYLDLCNDTWISVANFNRKYRRLFVPILGFIHVFFCLRR